MNFDPEADYEMEGFASEDEARTHAAAHLPPGAAYLLTKEMPEGVWSWYYTKDGITVMNSDVRIFAAVTPNL